LTRPLVSGGSSPSHAGKTAALVLATQEFVANGEGRPPGRRRRSAAPPGRTSRGGRRGCSRSLAEVSASRSAPARLLPLAQRSRLKRRFVAGEHCRSFVGPEAMSVGVGTPEDAADCRGTCSASVARGPVLRFVPCDNAGDAGISARSQMTGCSPPVSAGLAMSRPPRKRTPRRRLRVHLSGEGCAGGKRTTWSVVQVGHV
jgi:hypothetical protein